MIKSGSSAPPRPQPVEGKHPVRYAWHQDWADSLGSFVQGGGKRRSAVYSLIRRQMPSGQLWSGLDCRNMSHMTTA
jgi:hypothetical protein